MIHHQTTSQEDLELKENDTLYFWLDHLRNSSADLDGIQYSASVMVKQLDSGYNEDTAP